ncbi:MAG: RNA polymerase sigma factor [Ignavibacteriales bacterium]|nr:RNA polymerase sigma factor [Ignavibacteriales bacterium]
MEQEKQLLTEGADLIRLAKTGDNAAFLQLCRENSGRVYAVCLRMLANTELAKELTQDTIVRAWQMLHTFRGESPFGAWLHRIAVNAVLDHIRSEKRRSARVQFTDNLEFFQNEETISQDVMIDLEDAVASLPLQARTVIVLHDIEGYSHDEIGTMLGIASGTSKATLHRARTLLKARLGR